MIEKLKRNSKITKQFFVSLVLLFSTLIAYTQKTWDGGASTTNWGDANNWNPNGVPTATDAVTIPVGFTV